MGRPITAYPPRPHRAATPLFPAPSIIGSRAPRVKDASGAATAAGPPARSLTRPPARTKSGACAEKAATRSAHHAPPTAHARKTAGQPA
jgi:hypothetical protein